MAPKVRLGRLVATGQTEHWAVPVDSAPYEGKNGSARLVSRALPILLSRLDDLLLVFRSIQPPPIVPLGPAMTK